MGKITGIMIIQDKSDLPLEMGVRSI